MADLASIVDGLTERFGAVVAEPAPLDGGLTNRNFRVGFAAEDCVVRLADKESELLGISRDAERLATAAAAERGLAPDVLAAGEGFLVTRFVPGRPVAPAELRVDPAPVASALRAVHGSGLRLPIRFWVPELLDAYGEVIVGRGVALTDGFRAARRLVGRIAEALPLLVPVPCHNDLLAANLIRAEDRSIVLVDWEYAGMGHHLFDLANLAVNNELDDTAEVRLLEVYDGRPPTVARRAALALMRIVSDAREAAWGAVQAAISSLEFDFDRYAAEHLARLQRAASDPRFDEWLEVADGSTP